MDGGSGAELMQLQDYCQALERRRREFEQAARAARHKASLVFTKLIAARQARAVVEKLFDQQKRRHDRAAQKHEQRALDDMVNQREALLRMWQMNPETLWN